MSFKLDWLLRSLKELNTSSWSMAASYRDVNVPGDTGGARPAAVLGGLCVLEQILRVSTLSISMLVLHHGTEVLIRGR